MASEVEEQMVCEGGSPRETVAEDMGGLRSEVGQGRRINPN